MPVRAGVTVKQLNKHGEELCGDTVKVKKTSDAVIVVLSDGLGSGVKARILSSLTCEIIVTLFEQGIDLKETVHTLAKTLPVCKVRGIAYSTFTICIVSEDGEVRLINYDGPPPVIVKRCRLIDPRTLGVYRNIEDRKILDVRFNADPGDVIFMMSDGVLHAGLGNLMNFGWGWENVAEYLRKAFVKYDSSRKVVETVMELTNNYYASQPGDDSTLVGIRIKEKKNLVVFTGPPLDPVMDSYVVNRFLSHKDAAKVVCGGTTGNIVARELGRKIEVDLSTTLDDVPPIGKLNGVDLVTEGVLTLKKVIVIFKEHGMDVESIPRGRDGATLMARMLAESEEITLMVGQRINPFYQNPSLPFDMSVRYNLITELVSLLEKAGKKVTVEYF
ncbi:MAG: serine/threonine-protein phosphatase [Thermotogaceae bacterium]|nr:serine/threonine-protein phosphatase [Thermotogaceae bacterium]